MQLHIDKYRERFGCLPATVLNDKIYMNKDNRAILKDLEIKSYSKPIGRPPKAPKPRAADHDGLGCGKEE